MFKKIIVLAFLVTSLCAVEYKDESKIDSVDLGFFVGVEGGVMFPRNKGFDDTKENYGFYLGVPVYNGIEFLIESKKHIAQSYDSCIKSLGINIPISGKSSRQAYIGLTAGKNTLKFSDGQVERKKLYDNKFDGNVYSAILGKRFRYKRNFAIKVEAEYAHYGFKIGGATREYRITDSLEFVFGMEYLF